MLKIIELEPGAPLKKIGFLGIKSSINLYKIKVMITSLIEILELPNFGHMTTSTIWFESRDNILMAES